ncbi:MAG TPA: TetR family transcriptional regulator [Sphingobium sp.]|uniref:TetR/AcrR family transcriptional regulator n=1 Tax=Sphingobium sp. TaxID=1912891 RepID=UPI002ECFB0D6
MLDAVIALWGSRGHAGISARGVAQEAGLPTSSIYHHFGSLEHLFLEGQAHALIRAERWCALQLDLVGQAPGGCPDAFPALFAALIDAWSQEHRALCLTWHECHLLAARDPHYGAAINGWRELWVGFWEELCSRCGLAGSGEISSYVFDAESLMHMLQWRRPVDRACLDEFSRGWGCWLTGSLATEGPWRGFARGEALKTRPDVREQEGVAGQIAAAAADVVEQSGVAGLTHRAVAERAGVTLGTVSYNFRTSSDLIRATFETIYTRIVPAAGAGGSPPVGPPVTTLERAEGLRMASPLILALEELVVAVARDPAFRAFAPQLRYLRGRSSGAVLQAALGTERVISSLDAALYSGFLAGQGRGLRGRQDAALDQDIARTTGQVLALLGAVSGGAA